MVPGLDGQISQAAAKAVEQQAQAPAAPAKADEADVSKFEKLMTQSASGSPTPGTEAVAQQENASQTQGVEASQQTSATAKTDVPQGQNQVSPVADKPSESEVVAGLTRTSEEIATARKEILDRLAKSEDLSPKDLLEMQVKLAELTMQQTMIGKAGEKAEQAVQQLFRG
jgi:hypothetical protein